MTRYERLLAEVGDADIMFIDSDSLKQPAESMRIDDEYAIFLNERAFETESERFTALAHEKGHCDTGALYNVHSPLITRSRCEYRAWSRAIEAHLPYDELVCAFDACRTADGVAAYDVAEHLGITEEFLIKAVELYERRGLLLK